MTENGTKPEVHSLTSAQQDAARTAYYVMGKYIFPLFEPFEFGFCCDEDPEKEIALWIRMGLALDKFFKQEGDEDTSHNRMRAARTLVALGLNTDPLESDDQRLYKDKKHIDLLRAVFDDPFDTEE